MRQKNLPNDALVDVGSGVAEAFSFSGMSAKDTVEVGADFVAFTSSEGVALRTTGLEEGSTLGSVTYRVVVGQ